MRRMTRAEALAFLNEGARTAHVATVRPDGSPHVVPVWYVVDGDAVVFTIARKSVKARNLARDPRVTLSVDDDVFPYSFVTVSGRADIADRPADFLDWTTRIARRYLAEERAVEYGARNFELDDWVVRLRPERIFAAAEIAF